MITGNFLDDAREQLADAVLVLLGHQRALGIAHFLYDHLLGRLRRDAAKFRVFDLLFVDIPSLQRRVDLVGLFERQLGAQFSQFLIADHLPPAKRLVIPGASVDGHPDIGVFLEALLVAMASACSIASKMTFSPTPFSLDTASATSRISLFIPMLSRVSVKPGHQIRPFDIGQREQIFVLTTDQGDLVIPYFRQGS